MVKMTDFSQILEREKETKQAKNQAPILNEEKEAKKDNNIATPDKPEILKIEPKKDNRETEKKLKRPRSPKKTSKNSGKILTGDVPNPVWLNVAEAAKVAGVQTKTIRRAIKADNTPIKFKIRMNRYLIDARSLILYLHSKNKLKNKLYQNGLGQYIKNWKG